MTLACCAVGLNPAEEMPPEDVSEILLETGVEGPDAEVARQRLVAAGKYRCENY